MTLMQALKVVLLLEIELGEGHGMFWLDAVPRLLDKFLVLHGVQILIHDLFVNHVHVKLLPFERVPVRSKHPIAVPANLADRGVMVLTATKSNCSAEIWAEVPLAAHLEAALAKIIHVGRVELLDRVIVDAVRFPLTV